MLGAPAKVKMTRGYTGGPPVNQRSFFSQQTQGTAAPPLPLTKKRNIHAKGDIGTSGSNRHKEAETTENICGTQFADWSTHLGISTRQKAEIRLVETTDQRVKKK